MARPPTNASHPAMLARGRRIGGPMSGNAVDRRPDPRAPDLHAWQRRILGGANAQDKRRDELLLELRADAVLEADEALVDRQALAVGTRRRHGRKGVGDGKDPCDQRDLFAFEAIEIAPAVP